MIGKHGGYMCRRFTARFRARDERKSNTIHVRIYDAMYTPKVWFAVKRPRFLRGKIIIMYDYRCAVRGLYNLTGVAVGGHKSIFPVSNTFPAVKHLARIFHSG